MRSFRTGQTRCSGRAAWSSAPGAQDRPHGPGPTHLHSRNLGELFHGDIVADLHTDAHEGVRDRIKALADRVLHALGRHGGERLFEGLCRTESPVQYQALLLWVSFETGISIEREGG